jgi:hypothetical protein
MVEVRASFLDLLGGTQRLVSGLEAEISASPRQPTDTGIRTSGYRSKPGWCGLGSSRQQEAK